MVTLGRCQRLRRAAPVVLGSWLLVLAWMQPMAMGADAPAVAAAQNDDAQNDDAKNDDDEANPYRPGVIATFAGGDGVRHARLTETVWLSSDGRPPDRRLPSGPFTAIFRGHLLVQTPGLHRLSTHGVGQVEVRLTGRKLLTGKRDEPGWCDGESVDLPFGYHPLEVRYSGTTDAAGLALFWEGPNFSREPLAARWLFHEASDSPSLAFTAGQRRVRALGCAACHDVPTEGDALVAPALGRLTGNISRAWIVDRLTSVVGGAETGAVASQRMPHFGLNADDAASVADYLLATSAPTPAAAPVAKPSASVKNEKQPVDAPPPPKPSAIAGRTLFRSVGCLACHRVEALGVENLFGGGDLTQVAAKRPPDFFARWLAEPAALNAVHRMPVFKLTNVEIESLSLYLTSLGKRDQPPLTTAANADRAHVARGRTLVAELNCRACHQLPEQMAPNKRLPLGVARLSTAEGHCLTSPDREHRRPGYLASETARREVVAYLQGVAGRREVVPPGGDELLVERNCLACHARGHALGLAGHLPAIAEADDGLRDVLAGLTPPALIGVGDKLHDAALVEAIGTAAPPRQTWLRVRMPRFPLTEQETSTLVRHLIDADRMPDVDTPPPATDTESDPAVEAAGARLVTADGFGCTSCHAIGGWRPQKVALNAEGANLAAIGQRVRPAWFDRWVRNPARMVPQMEMPSIQQPIRGVLEGQLDRQIAAIWRVLERSDFTPPSPSALRVVRRANLPEVSEPAAVLTEVIEVGRTGFIKPLTIGLANRHNVLFDLERARLAAWWTGDTARQQTVGKSWLWEAGHAQLLPIDQKEPDAGELVLIADGQRFTPARQGQFTTECDAWQHVTDGLRFAYRLRHQVAGRDVTLGVTQQFTSLEPDIGAAGFRRTVDVAALPPNVKAELVVLPGEVTISPDGRTATSEPNGVTLSVALRQPVTTVLTRGKDGAVVTLDPGEGARCELDYRAAIAVDQFAPLPVVDRRVTRQELAVLPGFEAVRLPVTDQAMATGLAWRRDGTLVVSSLEGRVWLGRDTDGDDLVDALAPFSDDLAAPYGVAVPDDEPDAIDVINKTGLLRLHDADRDGRAERTELIASGWGHTRDYHDWAVGLPRDRAGNYYVSLPCQQDDRSQASAALRGTIVRLAPRMATPDDPRRFAVESICGGLRFGQGLALSASEDLFVTDNQGNYTPFNELNHVVAGARYGFINKLESRAGYNPPFRAAAVEIPHPWTRSVNGICFLPKSFGSFAGHLIGCEYDTRRLVRISLEKVDGEWQGAVYSFSREPAGDEATFEGPLVCQVSPQGDLFVGNLRDSGWGGGSNTGSIVRIRPRGDLPPGIAEVRAHAGGFTIDFTAPVDRTRAADLANYAVSSYRRIPTPNYGGPDVDARVDTVRRAKVSNDARRVTLQVDQLRAGFVYEFHLRDLAGHGQFFPAEAYYTLRHLASPRVGEGGLQSKPGEGEPLKQ